MCITKPPTDTGPYTPPTTGSAQQHPTCQRSVRMYKHTVLRTGACTSFGATARSRRERRISAVQADRHVAAPATASSICVARSVPRHTCMTIYYCQQCRVACMHASHEPARWRRDFCKGRRTAQLDISTRGRQARAMARSQQ